MNASVKRAVDLIGHVAGGHLPMRAQARQKKSEFAQRRLFLQHPAARAEIIFGVDIGNRNVGWQGRVHVLQTPAAVIGDGVVGNRSRVGVDARGIRHRRRTLHVDATVNRIRERNPIARPHVLKRLKAFVLEFRCVDFFEFGGLWPLGSDHRTHLGRFFVTGFSRDEFRAFARESGGDQFIRSGIPIAALHFRAGIGDRLQFVFLQIGDREIFDAASRGGDEQAERCPLGPANFLRRWKKLATNIAIVN